MHSVVAQELDHTRSWCQPAFGRPADGRGIIGLRRIEWGWAPARARAN